MAVTVGAAGVSAKIHISCAVAPIGMTDPALARAISAGTPDWANCPASPLEEFASAFELEPVRLAHGPSGL